MITSGFETGQNSRGPIIRAAVEADANSLVVLGARLAENDPFLVVTGFDPVTGAALIRSAVADAAESGSSEIFVAEIDNELAGFAICRRHPPPERNTILQLDLGVDDRYRRRGFGSALVLHTIDWARNSDIHRIQLAVVAENAAALSLYEKHSFVTEGTLRRGFRLGSNFHDVLVMARLLK
jgi:ribosomal protein S18 acetylase RimI-like enzyme